MTFAEKIVFLMQLTSTSNKQLAEAVKVDPSLISRFRNARRDAPKNTNYTKAMADYFAKKCDGLYQRLALSEAMGRKHLQLQTEASQLSLILFDWLTDRRDQVGSFFHTFERFSLADPVAEARQAAPLPAPKSDSRCFAYYGNEGKRGAVDAFVSHLMSLDTRGTILLSTDESMEWLFEEPAYLSRLQEKMMLLLKRGFRMCRIGAPLVTADQAFDSLSRWLPLYMTGQVDSFYYPRLRDGLYRRTLILLPGAAAVVSASTGDQLVSRATLFTSDQRLTNAFAEDFQDILAKCRAMMTTYSTAVSAAELLRCISQFESDRGDRIQQSSSLSSITAPPELIRLSVEGIPEDEATSIAAAMMKAQELFRQSLSEYEVTDIHSLATADAVRAGKVPVSVAYLRSEPPFCYTPETYACHLQSILEHMERYRNYHAILLPQSADTHVLMVKEGRQALLLRPDTPLVVFEISQPNIAEACREYLLRRAETALSPAMQRHDAISTIKHLIQELRK